MRLSKLAPLASLALLACSSQSPADGTGSGGGASSSSSQTSTSSSSGSTSTSSSTSSSSGAGGAPYEDPPGAPHGPIDGLAKIATAEYATGLLMNDGRILMASGQVTPVLDAPKVPAGTSFKDYAGGLHQSVAIDMDGRVWTWGATDHGLQGSGMDGGDASIPYRILTDADGNDFKDAVSVAGGYAYDGAVKSDGSVWVWGNCDGGMAGDGTDGGVRSKPTRVPFPQGVKIQKLVFSDIALALADDGSVWSWGGTKSWNPTRLLGRQAGDGKAPGKVEGLPAGVSQIASGAGFSYALTPKNEFYGWGIAGLKLGVNAPQGADLTRAPTDMSTIVKLPLPVKFVAANDHTTHIILTDGSLWGWGDDAEGEVGDGHEVDFGAMGPHSDGRYTWDWGNDEMPVIDPVRIASGAGRFRAVYTNTAYVFYVFAVTEGGHVYSWGRNKTGDLMNGVVSAAPLAGNIAATFPNSWDVTTPTNVNPLELQKNQEVTSPYCLTHQAEKPCDQFNNATGKAYYE